MASTLVLVSNPGSASRKYALFDNNGLRASLHFEWLDSKVACSLWHGANRMDIPVKITDLSSAAGQVISILNSRGVLKMGEQISRIGLRIVAPGSYFTKHRVINQHFVDALQSARPRAPLHITATLEELKSLHHQLPQAAIVGASDSAFHVSRPDYSKNYSIPLADANKLDIKRFGYHGLSAESVVSQLKQIKKITPRLVIAHLGSGASVTAVYHGRGVDSTMGYSPLEGLTMSTRSGNIDPTAVRALKAGLHLDDIGVENYLNKNSGLLGLGGSADIRELLKRESEGSKHAQLAMQTYIFNIQKAIGQMAGALGGLDQLVFTGTVGERNPVIRQRIASNLHYLDILLNEKSNHACTKAKVPTIISTQASSKPVFVVPIDESSVIASIARNIQAKI